MVSTERAYTYRLFADNPVSYAITIAEYCHPKIDLILGIESLSVYFIGDRMLPESVSLEIERETSRTWNHRINVLAVSGDSRAQIMSFFHDDEEKVLIRANDFMQSLRSRPDLLRLIPEVDGYKQVYIEGIHTLERNRIDA